MPGPKHTDAEILGLFEAGYTVEQLHREGICSKDRARKLRPTDRPMRPTDATDKAPVPPARALPAEPDRPTRPTDRPDRPTAPPCLYDVDGTCTSESSERPGENTCQEALGHQPDQQHCLGYRPTPGGTADASIPTNANAARREGTLISAADAPPQPSSAPKPGVVVPVEVLVAISAADELLWFLDNYKMLLDKRYKHIKAMVHSTFEKVHQAVKSL